MHVGQRVEVYLDKETFFAGSIAGLHTKGILVGVNNFNEFPQLDPGAILRTLVFEDGNISYFQSELKRKIRSTNLILLTYPKQIKKIERRNFFRVRIWEEIKVFYNERDTQKLPAWLRFEGLACIDISALPKGYKEARLYDISGGGLCMLTKEHIKEGKLIGIVLCLDNDPLRMQGRVTMNVQDKDIHKVSLKFEKISQIESNKIMRFVFERESGWLRTKTRENSLDFFSPDGAALEDLKNEKLNDDARHFRLSNIALPVEYKVVKEYGDIASTRYDKTVMRNVSFTGASIITEQKVDDDVEIWLKMHIANHNVRLLAKSVRCRLLADINHYEMGVKFQAVDMESSKRLVSFIHKEHGKQIKKAASKKDLETSLSSL